MTISSHQVLVCLLRAVSVQFCLKLGLTQNQSQFCLYWVRQRMGPIPNHYRIGASRTWVLAGNAWDQYRIKPHIGASRRSVGDRRRCVCVCARASLRGWESVYTRFATGVTGSIARASLQGSA